MERQTLDKEGKVTVSLRDESDGSVMCLSGFGDVFIVGLSTEGKLCGVLETCEDQKGICVSLFKLAICNPQGFTIKPATNDLQCIVNCTCLTEEVNLISDTVIQVANKVLTFVERPIPRQRRKLPHTPGAPLGLPAPAKPIRTSLAEKTACELSLLTKKRNDVESLTDDWCVVATPTVEKDFIDFLETPDQLGSLSASYFTKQINVYTDAALDSRQMDQVFKFFQDVAVHDGRLLRTYLTEMADFTKTNGKVNHSNFGPAVNLLAEILKQYLDPVEYVVLSLQLLRTFSHFSENLVTMVKCGATTAVLGSMAAYIDVKEVQQFSLDILAKVATYKPNIQEKAPLRETAVEMILRAIRHHKKQLDIVKPGCRALANLSTNLFELSNHIIDTEEVSVECEKFLEKCYQVINFLHQESLPDIQEALKLYRDDLGVKTEGRRFLYILARMSQLLQKKKLWLSRHCKDNEAELPSVVVTEENATSLLYPVTKIDLLGENATVLNSTSDDLDSSSLNRNHNFLEVEKEQITVGILKRASSFEDLHIQSRKVKFVDEEDSNANSSSDEDIQMLNLPSHIESHKIESKELIDDEGSEYDAVDTVTTRSDEMEYSSSSTVQSVKKLANQIKAYDDQCADEIVPYEFCARPLIPMNRDDLLATEESEGVENVPMQKRKTDYVETSNRLQPASPDIVRACPVNSSSRVSPDLVPVEIHTSIHSNNVENVVMENARNNSEQQNYVVGTATGHDVKATPQAEPVKESLDEEHALDNVSSLQQCYIGTSRPLSVSPVQKSVRKEDDKPGRIYSDADTKYMARVLRTQVIYYVSLLVHSGKDTRALQIIDLPIIQLLEESSAPSGLVKFARAEYDNSQSLMDVDAALLISIIDAVRYRHLLKELLQSSMTNTVNSLERKNSVTMVSITIELIKSMFEDQTIREFLSDTQFLNLFEIVLDEASSRLQQQAELEELKHWIPSLINFPV